MADGSKAVNWAALQPAVSWQPTVRARSDSVRLCLTSSDLTRLCSPPAHLDSSDLTRLGMPRLVSSDLVSA